MWVLFCVGATITYPEDNREHSQSNVPYRAAEAMQSKHQITFHLFLWQALIKFNQTIKALPQTYNGCKVPGHGQIMNSVTLFQKPS